MFELFEMNLKKRISADIFKKSARLVISPWRSDPTGQVNVVIECSERVLSILMEVSRLYIKCFIFR